MHFLAQRLKRNTRIYLDYAAATPVSSSVYAKMKLYFKEHYGNPSAIHTEGMTARKAIDAARHAIACSLNTRKEGIVFTGSGTESNNLAVYGTLRARAENGNSFEDMEIITSPIEHPSISETVAHLKSHGVVVRYASVTEEGMIDLDSLRAALSKKTVLVSFAYANSEVGTVQEVHKISRIIRAFEKEGNNKIAIHLDAAQAPLWLPCQIDRLGVDLMSLDAGKCEGPKGVGILAFRHNVPLKGIMLGGGQEFGLRAGTESTPLIVGASHAIVSAQEKYEVRANVARDASRQLLARLTSIEGVVLNGSGDFDSQRLPNNINISIPGIDTEYATVVLNEHGIAASTKSACSGKESGGSHVVREMTGSEARATSTLRMTHSGTLTQGEINRVFNVLKTHIEKVRAFETSISG